MSKLDCSEVNCFAILFIFLVLTSVQARLTYRKNQMNFALDSEAKPSLHQSNFEPVNGY